MGVVIITFFIFNEFLYVNGDANYVTGHDVSVDNILENISKLAIWFILGHCARIKAFVLMKFFIKSIDNAMISKHKESPRVLFIPKIIRTVMYP